MTRDKDGGPLYQHREFELALVKTIVSLLLLSIANKLGLIDDVGEFLDDIESRVADE